MTCRVQLIVFVAVAVSFACCCTAGVFAVIFTRRECPASHSVPSLMEMISNHAGYHRIVSVVRNHDLTNLQGVVSFVSGIKTDSQIARYDWLLSARGNISIESVRDRILRLFGTDSSQYAVVFTRSSEDAMRLFFESFPWTSQSTFWYHERCDASALSLRRLAAEYDAYHLPLNHSLLKHLARPKDDSPIDSTLISEPDNLLLVPLQEGFSGTKMKHSLLRAILRNSSREFLVANETCAVLADASHFTATNRLNLTDLPFHGVAVSFEKMFGFPSAGALIVQRGMLRLLTKKVFGASSLKAAKVWELEETPHDDVSRAFEDSPVSIRTALGVDLGVRIYEELGIDNIQSHCFELAQQCYEQMKNMTHSNGKPMIEIYGRHDHHLGTLQGSVIAFNVKKSDETYVHFDDVLQQASEKNIRMKGGCHCAPGSCFKALNLTEAAVQEHFQKTSVCGTTKDSINGVPIGAVKIEFTWPSTESDVDVLLDWINATYFE